eukprot:COSAG02_NODE_284_length_25691_cov_14.733354_3_plen_166_part_00
MPVVTPTKSGHNARRWCGHTCVVYAINPGIHARHAPIFTMVYVSPVLTTSHGRTRTDENGPRSFQLVHRAPRPHGPLCVSSRAFVVASWVCHWIQIASRRPRDTLRDGAPPARRPAGRKGGRAATPKIVTTSAQRKNDGLGRPTADGFLELQNGRPNCSIRAVFC